MFPVHLGYRHYFSVPPPANLDVSVTRIWDTATAKEYREGNSMKSTTIFNTCQVLLPSSICSSNNILA